LGETTGLFSKSKTADVPATERAAPCPDSKKVKLSKTLSKETISAMASDTLRAGGWVEAPPTEPKVGDRMPDGTVLAGISPDTNKPMYATPADASLTMTLSEARAIFAAKLDAHGHKDWRVPTKAELNVLFNNRAAIGGFDISGSVPAGWYWSSSHNGKWSAWSQRFSDGAQLAGTTLNPWSVRPVR
jgi:hypothetical protein